MILDMGGGTFDGSIIEDFLNIVATQYFKANEINQKSLKATELQHIFDELESAKQKLSTQPLQATPVKLLFGLKLVNFKGKRLNVFHAIFRKSIFLLNTAAFKITILINMFMTDGRLLHDRLSKSIVTKS